eukprot:CAMPEP_0184676044 /NCGR_PEP_ID=MMETSP0308-20130426/88136_1 /TAXON_ID=38269 /ORGANISM="Gloeochaete witrockiana, Strain SAG 46.84" /LENGTH=362 /DNA_ID=CAMNT_0027123845 /DNA_START=774 /DNA_END=1859 /DNA_ORIENTATION=-
MAPPRSAEDSRIVSPFIAFHAALFASTSSRSSAFFGSKSDICHNVSLSPKHIQFIREPSTDRSSKRPAFQVFAKKASSGRSKGFGSTNVTVKSPLSLSPSPVPKKEPVSRVKAGKVSPTLAVPPHIPRPPYAVDPSKKMQMGFKRGIDIKSSTAILKMRKSGRLAAQVLAYAGTLVKPGVTTDEIDQAVHEMIIANGAYPSPLHYEGFPKSVCTSVNDVVCHGIPDSRRLQDGDICNIDVTVYLDGYHGDTNATFYCGKVDDKARHLVETTRTALHAAIAECKPGVPMNRIGEIITGIAAKEGLSVVEEYCGHGIGTDFHTDPAVYHSRNRDTRLMKAGMTFTIEPMLNEGAKETFSWSDEW